MRTSGNTVLITGGSAGIGLALAKAFLAAGNTVIVCGRDPIRLEQAKEALPGITTVRCDLTRDEDLADLLLKMQRDFPQLNILVNNAAMMHICDFVENSGDGRKIEEEVQTNVLAPMKLTSLLLPVLQRQASAAIVLVSSGLAYVPVENLAVYSATKAALHAFSRALRRRLRKTGVSVFELLPPLVDTDLSRTLRMPKIQAAQVANELLKGLEREQYEVRVGLVKPLYIASKFVPSLAERMLSKAFAN